MMRVIGNGVRRGIGRFGFAGLGQGFLGGGQERSTEIISLTIQEIDQLSTISHYESSVEYLKQNHLKDSLSQLQFALHEAKNKYPWSINLHSCLMNRMSILHKLMNQMKDFQKMLEELYLISLSSKGPKNLDTIKHLVNYLTCLTIYSPKKCNSVLTFLASEEPLPQYALFFDALNDIREKKQVISGLEKLKQLPQGLPIEKIFKYNNLANMRVFALKQGRNHSEYVKELKGQAQDILAVYIQALIVAESNPEQYKELSELQTAAAEKLQKDLIAYLQKKTKELPVDKLSPKRILKHFNSHIISMNIASLLFDLQRINECSFFLKLSLEKAISDNQLQRVGIALNLLGRCFYLQGDQKWQQVYLDILDHTSTYPSIVIKEALSTYSKLLFQQGRTYQAEAYLSQSLSLHSQTQIQGLILPSYDFSF